jgi:hypothetical protein
LKVCQNATLNRSLQEATATPATPRSETERDEAYTTELTCETWANRAGNGDSAQLLVQAREQLLLLLLLVGTILLLLLDRQLPCPLAAALLDHRFFAGAAVLLLLQHMICCWRRCAPAACKVPCLSADTHQPPTGPPTSPRILFGNATYSAALHCSTLVYMLLLLPLLALAVASAAVVPPPHPPHQSFIFFPATTSSAL